MKRSAIRTIAWGYGLALVLAVAAGLFGRPVWQALLGWWVGGAVFSLIVAVIHARSDRRQARVAPQDRTTGSRGGSTNRS
ncbi:hypothetical protein [Wenxinia saemankumensis]|uniref:Uncharacterized protein n=1 Tax=Wenxinia saemankumensis TaxID=1447782 RepID=A0A1M5ZYG1_9RHOB|nr:hypothetical protein [Wenxinia saemankumensis]SHI29315.1 hypothetical protein SAMN05444417_0074 [Wenxinia saemankumensis]